MSEETPAERIVAAARTWIGTRFHHQGRVKKTHTHPGGVDCLGLLVGIARELELRDSTGAPLADFDRADYGHLPDGSVLLSGLRTHLCEVPLGEMRPGDIVLIALENEPRHLGVISNSSSLRAQRSNPDWIATVATLPRNDELGIIHAYAQARKVVEHALDAWWRERIYKVFRV